MFPEIAVSFVADLADCARVSDYADVADFAAARVASSSPEDPSGDETFLMYYVRRQSREKKNKDNWTSK